MDSFDAIIVGGGLAGAMTGLLLKKQGWDVLILEKSQYPKHKVCGEFLSPAVWPLFERAGISGKLKSQAGKEIKTLSLFWPSKKPLHAKLPVSSSSHSYAYGISRKTLDSFLLGEAQKQGCTVCENQEVLSIRQNPVNHSFIVQARNSCLSPHPVPLPAGERKGEEAPSTNYISSIVINTAGKMHPLSPKRRGQSEGKQRAFGFKTHFKNVSLEGQTTELFFFSGGYLGMLEIEDGFVNVCGKVEEKQLKESNGNFDLLLKAACGENAALALRMKNARRETEWLTCGPLKEGFKRAYENGIFYAGDAACFVEPFLGQGMTLAIASAFLLTSHLKKIPVEAKELERIGMFYAENLQRLYRSKLIAGRFFRPFAFSPMVGTLLRNFFSCFPFSLQKIVDQACSLNEKPNTK